MEKLRFGIIGTGVIASVHAKALSEIEDASLVSCYDLNEERAKKFAFENNCKAYSDIDEFFNTIDVVTVTTPSGAHLDVALSAIEHKKNVIIEKPLEITTERCKLLIEKAKENGVILGGIFQSRFHEAPLLIKKAIDEKRFGKIVLIDAQIKWYRSQEYYDSVPWHGTWKLDGGGALMNQGIHAIDLLSWFGGKVKSIYGECSTLGHENIEVEDTASAVLTFENGALGVIEASTASWPGFLKKIEITGTEGSVVLEEESLKAWSFKNERPEDKIIREKYSSCTTSGGGASDPKAISYYGHKLVFMDVIKALKTDTKPLITGEEAMKAVEIIESIYKSSREKKPVYLD